MDMKARLSLISVLVTAAMITVNHLYSLGASAFVLGAVLFLMPTGLWWWFRTTNSQVAFVGYLLMNVWIIVVFGLFKGLWNTVLPLVAATLLPSVSTPFPNPPLGAFGMEASGVLTFVGSLVVLYTA
jgi:hypothetical protein